MNNAIVEKRVLAKPNTTGSKIRGYLLTRIDKNLRKPRIFIPQKFLAVR